MLRYKSVTLEDKQWVEAIFAACDRRGNEYTFSNLFDWAKPMHIQITECDGCLICRRTEEDSVYSCPIGTDGVSSAIEKLLEESHENGNKLTMVDVGEPDVERIQRDFPGQFTFEERRDDFDYIYDSADLGAMQGRKHRIKRNRVNKFLKIYPDWRYESINSQNIHHVIKMAQAWYREAFETKEKSILQEREAVMCGLQNFEALGLRGGVIFIEENVVAFTFGKASCKDTMVVHAEKAFPKYPEAYTMIAKEFALDISKDYHYINREDDMGIEGLRVSKMSYRPEFFYKRFWAREV